MTKQAVYSLTINCLSDDMCKMAIEKGFHLPCVSITHYYGNGAKFVRFDNGSQELQILPPCPLTGGDEHAGWIALYLDPKPA